MPSSKIARRYHSPSHAVSLDTLNQRLPILPIGPAQLRPIQQLGHLGHALQHIRQEPRQPNALPLASGAHEVHPVVPVPRPHKRQPMGPEGQAARDRALAVLEQRGAFQVRPPAWRRSRADPLPAGSIEEGNLRVQDVRIAGDPDVVSDDVGKPQEIIGDPRADPRAVRRMPPVLDIAFLELTARREQDVLARQLGMRIDEGHDVLQLIAEAERAARTGKRRNVPRSGSSGSGTEASG